MNFAEISGLYENARRLHRLIGGTESTRHLQQRLTVVASDPKLICELALTLDHLEQFTRSIGTSDLFTARAV